MSMNHLATGRLRMDDPPKRARELAGTVFPPRETVILAAARKAATDAKDWR
jgi:hypothetical protein